MDDRTIIKYAMMFDSDDFPETMRDMAGTGGTMQTLLYANRFGGTEFYLPRWKLGQAPKREISNMLTVYSSLHVEQICSLIGGGRVYISKCTDMMGAIRKMEIMELEDAGMIKIDVARATGCSIRHVRQVCNG